MSRVSFQSLFALINLAEEVPGKYCGNWAITFKEIGLSAPLRSNSDIIHCAINASVRSGRTKRFSFCQSHIEIVGAGVASAAGVGEGASDFAASAVDDVTSSIAGTCFCACHWNAANSKRRGELHDWFYGSICTSRMLRSITSY